MPTNLYKQLEIRQPVDLKKEQVIEPITKDQGKVKPVSDHGKQFHYVTSNSQLQNVQRSKHEDKPGQGQELKQGGSDGKQLLKEPDFKKYGDVKIATKLSVKDKTHKRSPSAQPQ